MKVVKKDKRTRRIVNGKVKSYKRSLGSGWASNALKSLGYSARDVISEVMPNTVSMASTLNDTRRELNDALAIAAKKSNEAIEQGKSAVTKFTEKDLKEAIEDLKTGKIYNTRSTGGGFGDDFDLGFEDNFDFNEDFGDVDVTSDDPNTNVVVNMNIGEDNPMVEAQYTTAATVATGVEVVGKETRAASVAVSSSIAKLSVGLTDNLRLIHSEVVKLSTTLPKSVTEHAALSAKYYEESIGYQKQIVDTLAEIKSLYVDSQKLVGGSNESNKNNGIFDKLGYSLDLSGYKDIVKSQTKSAIDNNFVISSAKMMIDMWKQEREAEEMFGESKSLGAKALNTLLKTAIGTGAKKGAGKVDEFISSMILPFGMKMGQWQDDYSNPFKQILGNIFGIKAKPNMSADKSKYEKGAVAFDGKVHRAITDVIPTYLRMIASAVTGKEEIAFDYEKGVYNTVSNIRKEFKSEIRKSATNEFSMEKYDFGRIVDKLEGLTKEQNQHMKDTFEEFLYKMVESGDFVSFRQNNGRDDIARLTGKSSNDPTVQLIRSYFEGLYDEGRHQELNDIFSKKTISARANVQKTVSNMTADGTSHNYNLIDNGLDESGSNSVKIGHSAGLASDKYGRNSTSYLRDILGTLATGIKVVNVGSVNGDPTSILRYSNRILSQLNLDVQEYNARQNSSDGGVDPATIAGISYDAQQSVEAIAAILKQTEVEDGVLAWFANKYGDRNALGRAAKAIKGKRDELNRRADDLSTKLTGKGIDAIYGKRETPEGDNGNTSGPSGDDDSVIVNPPGLNDPRATNIILSNFRNQLRTFGSSFAANVITPLNEALFNEQDGLVTRIEDAQFDGDNENATVEKAKNKIADGARSLALGEKDEDGNYQKGLMSEAANAAALAKRNIADFSHELIYGSDDGKEKGIIGNLRQFFGENENGKLDVSGKMKALGGEFKEHFKARAYEWTDLIFGKEGDEESKLDVFLGDMKGKKGKIGASAVVGALGSFFLPGGPVGGALIGASVGMISQSTQMKDFLFGKEDADGNRVGGFITKEFQDYFKKNGKTLKVGAGVGLIGSMFLPGGPITGALIGSGLAMAAKSEAFSNILYGEGGTKDDPTGGITKYIKEHYNKNKDVKSTFMDAGIGAGVGIVGSFFLPGGPITGALIGAGASIALNTDKFKDYFFGQEDPEDGKRKGGVFGKYKDKIVEKAEEAQDKLSLWVQENITNPVAASIEPLKKKAKRFLFGSDDENGDKGLMGAIADRVNNSAFGELKKAVKENIIDKMKDGFNKIFGGFFKLIGSIIKSPVTALKAIAEDADKENGGDGAPSIAKRIEELNAKSREKIEQRKANRSKTKSSTKGSTEPTDNATTSGNEDSEVANNIEETSDNVAKVASTTEEVVNVVQEQLSTSKEQHTEKVSILRRILDVLPKRKKNQNNATSDLEEDESPKVVTGSSLTGSNPIDRISSNVEKIAKSVDGQLNGAGYNIHRIYKLLRKKLKKSGDDEDDDGDGYDEAGNKKYRGFGGKLGKIKDIILKPAKFLKSFVFSIGDAIKDGLKKTFGGIIKVGKTILGIPKLLFNGVKKAVPTILKGIGETFKLGATLIGNGLRAAGNIIEEGAKGFGNFISGALSGFGSLMHGLGIFGKEALQLIAKGGAKAITGVAKAGSFIAKSAVGAVSKIFGKKNKGNNPIVATNVTIDGGHLDYVTVIKRIGGDIGDDPTHTPGGNIIPFPGNVEQPLPLTGSIGDTAQGAAAGGFGIGNRLKGFGRKISNSAAVTRLKGSAENIRNKFKREDAEEDQRNWREKILNLLHRNTDNNEEHHSIWNSIFSKKGLITMALIALSPLLIKAVQGIISFFSESGIGARIADALKNFVGGAGEAIEDEGGLVGVANNANELGRHITDALGITDRERYKIDPVTGAILTDENGNPIKEEVKETGLARLKNFFLPEKTRIDHETGRAYHTREYNHETEIANKTVVAGWKKGVVKPVKGALRKYAKHQGLDRPSSVKDYVGVVKHGIDSGKSKVNKFTTGVKNIGEKIKNSKLGTTVANYADDIKLNGGSIKDIAANSKIGQKITNTASNLKTGVSKVAGNVATNVKSFGDNIAKKVTGSKTAKKVAGAVSDSDTLTKAMKFMKEALDTLVNKFAKVAEKFGKKGSKNVIKELVEGATKKIMNVKVLSKFLPKITGIFSKMAAAAGTLLVSEAAWVVVGAVSGAANPGELFSVDMDDIPDMKTRAVMRAIAGVFGALLGTSIGSWVDLICEIVEEVSGYSLTGFLATEVLNIISDLSGSDMKDQLASAQDKFNSDYDAYLEEEYNAYAKNQEQSGQAVMSFDEYRQSDLATSRTDYKAEVNPSLGKRIWDGAKKIGGKIADGAKAVGKGIKNTFTKHDEEGWFDANGSYYVKFNGVYNHYNANGDMIGTVAKDEVDQMIESGLLKKKAVTVKSNLATGLDMAATGVKNLWNSATKKASEIRDKWSKRISDFGEKISENPIAKFILPHKETVLTSTNGSYYMQNDSGNYDYYNALGVMIASNIPADEVTAMLEAGQLSESSKWITGTGEKVNAVQRLGHTVFKGFKDLVGKGKEVFDNFKSKVSETANYWKENIKENGIFGAVKNAFAKKKKKAWYDVKGGYYVENEDGSYNYHNANGDLVSENVDKDEVQDMMLQGLLTEGEIVEDSDAQNAIKGIKSKISDLWSKAKEAGSGALDNVKKWLGLGNESDYVSGAGGAATAATNVATGGKGSGDSESTSNSGTVNGFAYYSQNDPSIKNKAYNLSDGTRDTMGERGCGPAAMSMVASQLTGKKVDPLSMANMATSGGFSIDSGTSPDYFHNAAAQLGLSSQSVTPSRESIEAMLRSGKPVILQGQDNSDSSPFTNEGHYVVGVGMNGDNIIINDPRGRAYSKEYNIDSVLSGAQNSWGFSNSGPNVSGNIRTGFAGLGSGVAGDMLNGFPFLLQTDDRWGDVVYTSIGDNNQTISSSACGPTSMAMILRSFGNNVSPIDTSKYSVDNGFRTANNGTSWGFFNSIGSTYGITTKQHGDANSAIDALQDGHPIIASMGPDTFTSGGHYIVMSGVTGDGKILVNDPNSKNRSNTSWDPSIFSSEGKQYWSFSKDGKGSVNNIQTTDPIEIDDDLVSSMGLSENKGESAIEGSPSSSESSEKSVLELLSGAAAAFLKPITEWMTGKKSSGESSGTTGATAVNSSMLNGLGYGTESASIIPGEGKQKIWNYFASKGMTKAGIAGLMGNLEAESGNLPVRVQGDLKPPYEESQEFTKQVDSGTKDFIHGFGGGYGLAQWTSNGRKQGLLNLARSRGRSIGDLQVQLDWLNQELTTSYKNVNDVLHSTNDIKTASDIVLHKFERPADRSVAVENKRAANAKGFHDLYANSDTTSIVSGAKGGKGGKGASDKPFTISEGGRLSSYTTESGLNTYNTNKNKATLVDNPLFAKMVELLGSIVDNTSDIDQGVKDLFTKESSPTQIITKEQNNSIIPVPQKSEEKSKDNHHYNTAKRISAGVYLS